MRDQQVLHDKKWIKFLKRTWLFKFAPFVEFALAAGSMAMGNVRPESDFDVIIGARSGRIFTARFFAVIAFGAFGWRRKKIDHREAAADKICLNHFVTPASYRLSPPHNAYWRKLYQNLVPLFGSDKKVNDFFAANSDWLGKEIAYVDDLRHYHRRKSWPVRFVEWTLSGWAGDFLEKRLRKIQISRIENGIQKELGHNPRIIYTDQELEFHPDTARIELLERSM
ncbi:MAG: hypothetical protein HYT03_02035 [Candidatus Harrisonbacteria bacterium]|nr:hypothetical protein [Candidatus Harrisonbacteria bacterium]